MLFSAFADEISTDFEKQLFFLKENNINFIELRFVDSKNIIDLNEFEIKEVRSKLEFYGIGVSAIASPIGKVNIDSPFEAHIEKFRYSIFLAEYFQTKLIRVFSYYLSSGETDSNKYRDKVIDRMLKKADLLRGSDIKMVHENEADIYGHSAANCVDIVKTVDSSNLRLAYDPANFVWGEGIKNNFNLCWSKMKPYVEHVHIKDWKLGSKNVGCVPGEGDAQIRELANDLIKSNYQGFITMEPHLELGGQFGGKTNPDLFKHAINSMRLILNEERMKLQLT